MQREIFTVASSVHLLILHFASSCVADYDDFATLMDDVPEVEGGRGLSDDEGNGDPRSQQGRGRPSAPVGQRKPAVPQRDNRPSDSANRKPSNFGSMGLELSDDDEDQLLRGDRGDLLDDDDDEAAESDDGDFGMGDDDLEAGRHAPDRSRAPGGKAGVAGKRGRRDLEDDDNDF